MKVSELIAQSKFHRVPHGRNIAEVSWVQGYLLVRFSQPKGFKSDRVRLYIFGPNIPEAERDKLLRVPYPDKLFTQNIRGKYQCHKVERAA